MILTLKEGSPLSLHMSLSLINKLFVELRNIILELNGELYFLSLLLVAALS